MLSFFVAMAQLNNKAIRTRAEPPRELAAAELSLATFFP